MLSINARSAALPSASPLIILSMAPSTAGNDCPLAGAMPPWALLGFVPIGEVTSGMAMLDSLYDGYGEGPPYGIGPNQGLVMKNGNAYLAKFFPSFDFVKTARVTAKWPAP